MRLAACVLGAAVLVSAGERPAWAWDAGNPAAEDPKYSATKCVKDTCSGGVIKPTLDVAGKVEGWFTMSRPADCPAGYTNNGLTCGRGADSISAPSRLADCPSGYRNIGPAGCLRTASTYSNPSSVADCPKGYTNMGATCFKPPFSSKGMGSMRCKKGSVKRGARCYPKCRKGYTNNGEFCGRGASSKGPGAFRCPKGYFKGVTKDRCHRDCPSGYRNMGETCFRGVSTLGMGSMKCRKGEVLDSGRCIPVPNVKMRGNTHLWVVQGALALLEKTRGPAAAKAVAVMKEQGCADQWMQGLYDGDEPTYVDDPTQTKRPTAGTHFYNPTGVDAFGKPTKSVTYLLGETDVSTGGLRGKPNLTAKACAHELIQKIPAEGPTAASGCHELGLALHYMTDVTQPMHASSFSGISGPMWLHPYFEAYVPVVQGRFPARGAWKGRGRGMSPDDAFEAAARAGNRLAPQLMTTLTAKGKRCTIGGLDLSPLPYAGFCFVQDARVDKQIGVVLRDAYQSTAGYIHSVFERYAREAPSSPPPVVDPGPVPTSPASRPSARYTRVSNAAISGHNKQKLRGASVDECARACTSKRWCRSFDYHRADRWCDLSDKRARDVGGLKRNYPGHPYDHYQRE